MLDRRLRYLQVSASALLLALAAGCSSVSLNQAPIIERSERRTPPPPPPTAAVAPREAPDGQYVVQRGDTLYSIALAFGQDHRDLARWNGLDDPTRLQIGQSLRVRPPTDAPEVAALPVAPAAAPQVRPLDSPRPLPPSTTDPTPAAPAAGEAAKPAAAPAAPPPGAQESGLQWIWPATGKVIEGFDEARNKGIDIAGTEGEPVRAAGDGQVVYVGSGLRGYGNLVIVKHTDEYISAYAHNREILVKQGQAVKRGQTIAELGRSGADLPKLHFEVRRGGKPVDPLRYLPPR